MQTLVAVRLWVSDVVFGLDNRDVFLVGQHIGDYVGIFEETADDSNVCDIKHCVFDSCEGELVSFSDDLFDDAFWCLQS